MLGFVRFYFFVNILINPLFVKKIVWTMKEYLRVVLVFSALLKLSSNFRPRSVIGLALELCLLGGRILFFGRVTCVYFNRICRGNLVERESRFRQRLWCESAITMVKTIYAQVAPDGTVLQMMQKIHKKKGYPIHEMQLLHNNRQLEQDKTLKFYGINNGSSLTLRTFTRSGDCPCSECKRMEKKVTIHVVGLQKEIKVECKLGEPVETLKNAIRKKEGIPVAKQKLKFNDLELEDHKLLASYDFGDDEEEAGEGAEPVVHLVVDPTVFDKLRSTFSFKGTKSAPAPAS